MVQFDARWRCSTGWCNDIGGRRYAIAHLITRRRLCSYKGEWIRPHLGGTLATAARAHRPARRAHPRQRSFRTAYAESPHEDPWVRNLIANRNTQDPTNVPQDRSARHGSQGGALRGTMLWSRTQARPSSRRRLTINNRNFSFVLFLVFNHPFLNCNRESSTESQSHKC